MIGERVRVARARARKTLREVGFECGVTAQAVKKYEDNIAMPGSKVFMSLCRSLDVSQEWLIDTTPLDFHSTKTAPQGRHAKYWVREAIAEIIGLGVISAETDETEDAPND